ncbi:MAG: leucyl aminopeptidase [Spirochaetes bacterium]|jgi:leucyl aminopeptidase|nr:leucyl aminopeptidase [Spirochaetota bacterium]
MKLLNKNKNEKLKSNACAAMFLSEEDSGNPEAKLPPQFARIKDLVDLKYFNGRTAESMFLPFKSSPSVILVGIGKKEEVTPEHLRNTAQRVVSICRNRRIKEINVIPPSLKNIDKAAVLRSFAEGIYLSNYSFNRYKTKDEERKPVLERAIFYSDVRESGRLLKEIEIICGNTILCRDLVNETSEKANPVSIAGEARKLGRIRGLKCRVFGKKDIQKLKAGLLLAVSRGSRIPPQLVVLSYNGNPRSRKNTVIIGKGITFDSGGMNLKPSAGIETMRQDMAGAAAALYAVKAIAELGLKKNVTAVMPLCENMISNDSYRPGDIFRAYNGKSVEIANTDAEGRLILADAIAYAEKKFKPDYIVDIATLTGACLVCFAEYVAAVVSNNDKLADAIFRAGEKTGERVWRLPLYKEYDEDLKSDIADIKNVSATRNAGTILGGIFLKNFIKNTPWAHIDIAGTAWYSKQRGYRPKYATGFGVRLFVDLVKDLKD